MANVKYKSSIKIRPTVRPVKPKLTAEVANRVRQALVVYGD